MDVDFNSSSFSSTVSCSGSGSSPPRQRTLDEQHRKSTDELIQVKFQIAEQKGTQGLLNLDWQKLRSEQSDLQKQLENVEGECDNIREETGDIRIVIEKTKVRLDEIQKERSPEQKVADEVREEYTSVQEELKATKEDMANVKLEGEKLSTEIDDLKRSAAQISSDRATLATESDNVEHEMVNLHDEIARMKQSIVEKKTSLSRHEEDIIVVRKASDNIAKQNAVLESKIHYREDLVTKKNSV